MTFSRVALLSLLTAGCSLTNTPSDAAMAPDTVRGDAGHADTGPQAATPVPDFGVPCIDGWCFEAPRPLGIVSALHAVDGELFGAVDLGDRQRLFRFADGQVTFPAVVFASTAAAPVRFASSSARDVWAYTPRGEGPIHFDGTAWASRPCPAGVDTLVSTGPDRAWVSTLTGRMSEWSGSEWVERPLPLELINGDPSRRITIASVAGAPDGSVTLGADVLLYHPEIDAAVLVQELSVWQWDGAAFVRLPIANLAGPLWAFGRDDLWIGASHWDGRTLDLHPEVSATVVGGRPGDVWAGGAHAWRWDGIGWTDVGAPDGGLAALTAAAPNAWALDALGGLHFFDGVAWQSVGEPAPSRSIVAVAATVERASPSAWAVADDGTTSSVVLARATDGRWSAVPETSSGPRALHGVFARAADDAWAFGDDAVHWDGASWTHHPVRFPGAPTDAPPSAVSLCADGPDHAYATFGVLYAPFGIAAWDGTSWSASGRIDTGDWSGYRTGVVRCLPSAGVWVIAGPVVGQLVDGRWRATAPVDSLYTTQFFAPSPSALFAATQRGLARYDGAEWTLDPLLELAPPWGATVVVDSVDGSSATDLVIATALYVGSSVGPPFVVAHHDGASVDRMATLDERVLSVHSVGPDVALLLDVRGGVHRYAGGTLTTILAAGTIPGILIHGEVLSPSDAWATTGTSLLHFDGTGWSSPPGAPAAFDVVALGPDDVWTLDGADVGHYDGATWTMQPRATAGMQRLVRLGAGELWAYGGSTMVWHHVGGAWVASVIDDASDRNYRIDALGGSSSDLWVAGAHAPTGSIVPWLYHSDGVVVRSYESTAVFNDLREMGGELFARAYTGTDEVWQRTGGRWVPRSDLDPAALFGAEPLPFAGVTSADRGLRWLAGGAIILRHDP